MVLTRESATSDRGSIEGIILGVVVNIHTHVIRHKRAATTKPG